MKTTTMMSLVVVLGATATACGPRGPQTQIGNPLQTGNVAANAVEAPDPYTEAEFELPNGSLTSRASLVSLDESEVCFEVALQTLGERQDLASPKGWRVFLRGEPEFEDKAPAVREEAEKAQAALQGSIQRQRTSTERICDDTGANCYNREIVTTYREPAVITVLSGGGTVCFSNNGKIKPTTEYITLHLDDPTVSGAAGWFGGQAQKRLRFTWKFN